MVKLIKRNCQSALAEAEPDEKGDQIREAKEAGGLLGTPVI